MYIHQSFDQLLHPPSQSLLNKFLALDLQLVAKSLQVTDLRELHDNNAHVCSGGFNSVEEVNLNDGWMPALLGVPELIVQACDLRVHLGELVQPSYIHLFQRIISRILVKSDFVNHTLATLT